MTPSRPLRFVKFVMPGQSLVGFETVAEVEAAQSHGDRFWIGFFAGTLFGMAALALIFPIFS